jgi:hypothetical protein
MAYLQSPGISILGFQVPFSINQTAILWSCELHFSSGSRLLAPPNSNFAPPEKPKTGKLLPFSDFHKHLSGPYVLVCLISLVSSPSC